MDRSNLCENIDMGGWNGRRYLESNGMAQGSKANAVSIQSLLVIVTTDVVTKCLKITLSCRKIFAYCVTVVYWDKCIWSQQWHNNRERLYSARAQDGSQEMERN